MQTRGENRYHGPREAHGCLKHAALASSRPDSTLGVKRWNIVLEMLFNYSTIKLRASGEGETKPNTRREPDVPQKVDLAYISDAEVCFSR